MTYIRDGKINDRWEMMLLAHRVEFHAARPGWEAERLASCAEVMQPGMTVFDLGAECGDFTALYGMWVGPTGTVVPVEPSPPYWPSIRAHWYANSLPPLKGFYGGFISNVNDDLPDSQWSTEWSIPDAEGWPAISIGPIVPEFGFRHLAQQTSDTPQITIDSLVHRTGLTPDVIVMDIEGAELHALWGAQRTLERDRPVMYVSVHRDIMRAWYSTTPEMITDYMATFDYEETFLGEGTEIYMLYTPR